MKNKYRDSISKLHVSEELERKILNMTVSVNKEKKQKRISRVAYTLGVMLMIFAISVSIVYAKEIKSFITTVLSSENGEKNEIGDIDVVNINQQNSLKNGQSAYVSTLEKELGIDLLTSSKATNYLIDIYDAQYIKTNIARVDLWYADFILYPEENSVIYELNKCLEKNDISKCGSTEEEYQNLERQRKFISLSVAFITKYADESYISPFRDGIDATGGKEVKQTYHIESLNIDAVIYGVDWNDTRLTATFVYDNMLYTFIGNNINDLEMIEILDSLK